MDKSTVRMRANHYIHMCYIRQDYRECLSAIERVLHECNGQSEYPLYIKGLILRQRGKIEESLPVFQAALFLNPKNVNNLKQVGQTLYLMGKHREALEVFEQASDMYSEDRAIWYCKGLCCKLLHDYDDAIEHFKTSNSILHNEKSFMAIAEVLQLQGEYEEALECYVEAAEVFPENSDILTACGLAHHHLGDGLKAFEYLGNALTYDPLNTKAILGAGAIIQSNGDYDVALTKYVFCFSFFSCL
jgi:Bardet-Biedl syndrome 4 protein